MSLPLLSVLLALLAWSAFERDRERIATALALLVNLLACWGFWQITYNPHDAGSGFDPLALFAIDFTTAALLIVGTETRQPLAVVAVYLIECTMHAAVCLMGEHADRHSYAIGLEALAWLQAAIVGGWNGHIAYRRHVGAHHRDHDAAAGGAGLASVEREGERP